MIEWMNRSSFSLKVTLYSNNFTLNTHAAKYFLNAPYCMIGIDKEKMLIALKPILQKEIEFEAIPYDQLHKVSIGNGYARISNKSILSDLSLLLNTDVNGLKFQATYDKNEAMLLIDLMKPL